MEELLATARAFLELDEWPYMEVPGQSGLAVRFSGDNGTFQCYLGTREEDRILFCHAFVPDDCPLERRPAMTELLTRANYGMYLGAFEMDLDDGEIRFKSSVDVEGVELTAELVRNVLYTACAMMDRYLPAIEAVARDGLGPRQALAMAEGSPH